MLSEATIRRAIKNDVPAILGLIQELAVFEREPHAVMITADDLLKDGFDDPPSFICFVAEINHQVVGLALGYPRYSTWKGKTLHLEDLIVKQSFRGRGIGFSLFRQFIFLGHQMAVRRIEWNVLDWNTPAIDFYKKNGATVLQDWQVVQLNDTAIKKFITLHKDANI